MHLLSALLLSVVFLPSAFATLHYTFSGEATPRLTSDPLVAPPSTGNHSSFINIAQNYEIAQVMADSSGNTYVAGYRVFATSPNPVQASSRDVLIAKLDSSGNTLFTTTISGKGNEQASSIAVDPLGNIYLAGSTTSSNFPLRGPLQNTGGCQGCTRETGFVTKLSPDGSQMIYSTYFGGVKGLSAVSSIVVDAAGNAYVAGTTSSSDYPTTAGLPTGAVVDIGVPSVSGAFFAKLSPQGDQILYSGLLVGQNLGCSGGSSCFLQSRGVTVASVALDSSGNLYLAGNTNTTDLPTTSSSYLRQGVGPYLARVNTAGNSVQLTYLSSDKALNGTGASFSSASSIAIDGAGNLIVAGTTSDATFPVTPGALRTVLNNVPSSNSLPVLPTDAFVLKMKPDLSGIVWATYLGGAAQDTANSVALDSAGNIWVAGNTVSADFPNGNGWITGSDYLAAVNASGSALIYSALYPMNTVSASIASAGGAVHRAGISGLVSTINVANPPVSDNIFVLQNAATGLTRTQIAPGEIISIFGNGIGPVQPMSAIPDANGFYPTLLNGVQVLVNGTAAPMLYVSPTQINAVVPLRITGTTASVQVVNSSRTGTNPTTDPFLVPLISSAPGIFRIDRTDAVALNQDGTINSASNRAPAGSTVAIWVTGVSGLDPALRDGQVQSKAVQTGCCGVQVQYQPVLFSYAGDAPSTITGLTQVNFQIPSGLGTSIVPVSVTSGTQWDTAYIYVQ